jgi:hypothetical protein
MAQSQNGGVSSFDLLCPELLDDIVEKVAKDDPASLKELAKVNKAFLEAEQKCRQTLIIRWLQNGMQKRGRAAVECRQLSKELSERPKVSKLILTGEAPTSLLTVLSRIHWKRVTIGACGPNLPGVQCALRLSGARSSLRTLVLTSSSIELYTDIRCMVDFFPNLQDLTLRGMVCSEYRRLVSSPVGRSLKPDNINGNLERLDVSRLSLLYASAQLPRVLKCLKNVKSWKTWAHHFGQITLPDNHFFMARLQRLHLKMLRQSLNNFVLQSVANHCPSLEQLIIFSESPCFKRLSEEPLDILSVLDKCPSLERFFISCAETYKQTHFLCRASELGITSIASDLLSKTLIERAISLDALVSDNPARNFNLKEFSIFLTIFQQFRECRINQNRPDFREQVIGEPAAIQSWCETFCEAEGGQE